MANKPNLSPIAKVNNSSSNMISPTTSINLDETSPNDVEVGMLFTKPLEDSLKRNEGDSLVTLKKRVEAANMKLFKQLLFFPVLP